MRVTRFSVFVVVVTAMVGGFVPQDVLSGDQTNATALM
jgi:hypothetical protein